MKNSIPEFTGPDTSSSEPSKIDSTPDRTQAEPVNEGEHEAISLAAARLDLWDWDLKRGTLIAGERSANLIGMTAEEHAALGQSWYKIIHPDDRLPLWSAVKAHLKGHTPFISGEFRVLHKDGHWVWLLSRGNVVERDKNGRATRIVGFDIDITERKIVEEVILLQKELALALSATSNLNEALELCVDTALRITGLDGAGIYLRDDDSNLHLVAHKGVSEEFVHACLFMPSGAPSTQMVLEGAPRYMNASDAGPPFNTILKKEGLQGVASIPIAHGDSAIASFYLASRTLYEIPVSTRHFLEVLASQIGAAITRIRAENSLKESEQRFRTFAEGLPQVVFETDDRGTFLFLNKAGLELGGFNSDDLDRGLSALDIIAPEYRERARTNIARILAGKATEPAEYDGFRKDGSRASIVVYSTRVMRDGKPVGLRGLCVDITQLKDVERSLKETLAEKEVLLRELHHRVKNNLQVIQSLLRLQARRMRDKTFHEMVKETENRISSMALMHEQYCRSDNLADLDMTTYVSRIVDYLVASHSKPGSRICVQKEVQVIRLNIDTAMHVGLLLTELFIHCLKHAFSTAEKSEIRIMLRATGEDRYELMVGGSAEGMGNDTHPDDWKSTGLGIIDTMLNQVDGTMEIVEGAGTEWRIAFRDVHRPRM